MRRDYLNLRFLKQGMGRIAVAGGILAGAKLLRMRDSWRHDLHSKGEARRIWMVNHYAVTGDLPGGSRHVDLAAAIKQHGWTTTIFASSFNHNTHKFERENRFPRLVTTEDTASATFKWLPTVPYQSNGWKRYLNMVSFVAVYLSVAAMQSRPDVIIGSSGHLLAPFGAWIMSRWFRVPFVLEVRDMWPDGLIELGLNNRVVIALLRGLERFLYGHADRIVVVSNGIGDRVVAKGVPREKVVAVPHGVVIAPPSPDAESRDDFRKRMGWDDYVVAIWAGGMQPMNGLDTLVEAARHLIGDPSILVVFVGDGSEKPALMLQAAGLPNVRFYDPVPKAEVSTWLRGADVGVLTSRKFETFTGTRPRKLFDYMAAGLPVVCTVPGEASGIVRASQAGVNAAWENPIALSHALKTLAADGEMRRTLGKNGQLSVQRDHSIASSAKLLIGVLDGDEHTDGRRLEGHVQ